MSVESRVKISSLVDNQLPSFVRDDHPLVGEFLSQYYLSLEGQGSTLDIVKNIDQYVKVDNLTNLTDSTNLAVNVGVADNTINVDSTLGFPKSYGLIQIDSEIITYTGVTTNSFTGCVRGFSGISSFRNNNHPDEIVFSTSGISTHSSGKVVNNLSVLFLKEFFNKLKKQVTPGFEDRQLSSNINKGLFIKQAKDFYSSKGTDDSFEILFRALYGKDVEVIKPRDYLFTPSDAQYQVSKQLVVKSIKGNPHDLINQTIFQDFTSTSNGARGSVNNVEELIRGDQTYYRLSLDYDFDTNNITGFGQFSIHPSTKLVTAVSVGATVLDVDSTVGFAQSGSLSIDHPNGTTFNIDYESKSLNQFFGCKGISQNLESKQTIRINNHAYGYVGVGTIPITFQVTGVLEDLDYASPVVYSEVGDSIRVKTLGSNVRGQFGNNWIFNISPTYSIEEVEIINDESFVYSITTKDNNIFNRGDNGSIILNDSTDKKGVIISVLNAKTFYIQTESVVDVAKVIEVRKTLSKVDAEEYPELKEQNANVQNVYLDQQSYYVASPSLPNYLDEPIQTTDRSVTFSGTFNDTTNIQILDHGLFTGDSVTYVAGSDTNKLNIDEKIYYVKKVDQDNIKLSKSRSDIAGNLFVSLSGTVENNKLELSIFAGKRLSSQNLIRQIKPSTQYSGKVATPEGGKTGILVNGVEISNYKSEDYIFSGPIQDIEILSPGEDYDVINPPLLDIQDVVGSGISVFTKVSGNFKRIELINTGFGYVDVPTITITGGNGTGARAVAKMKEIIWARDFISDTSDGVRVAENLIIFKDPHLFNNGEPIIYTPDDQQVVTGLSTNSQYFARTLDPYAISLHSSKIDAIDNINPISISNYGVGVQKFITANKKKIVSSVDIINPGVGYCNNKTLVKSTGITTSSNILTIPNHGYSTGEKVVYQPTGVPIGGLSAGTYYVKALSPSAIKLSEVGVGDTLPKFYLDNDQYVGFNSTGSGEHIFNYPPIEVSVDGVIGVTTYPGQDIKAVVQPIVRGGISKVFVKDGGVGYGSSDIINYNRQPEFKTVTGKEAQLDIVTNQGRIVAVNILNPGSQYNSPPTLNISGVGTGGILVPIMSNGTISDIGIVSPGLGYEQGKSVVNVTPSGKDVQLRSNPKAWNINNVERLIQTKKIEKDDGVFINGLNSEYGIQYTHAFAPRDLRQTVYGVKQVDGKDVFVNDLSLNNGVEVTATNHSPIIGWSYDGYPIYGPYGYATPEGGFARLMRSSYKDPNDNIENRPSASIFPAGFFTQDYEYSRGLGDLDEHNGRFGVTPEYPNGTYAYFTTINPNTIESVPPFKYFRKPIFPYIVGSSYYGNPNGFNFSPQSNQKDIDVNEYKTSTNLLRVTTPYNLISENTSYDFIVESNKIQPQITKVNSTSRGTVESVGIITGGHSYQYGDEVIFNNNATEGTGASASVNAILGKEVHTVSVAKSSFTEVELVSFDVTGGVVGYTTIPHEYKHKDIIEISGLSTSSQPDGLVYSIGIQTNFFTLTASVGSTVATGIVTYFNVEGNLEIPYIRENDILGIGTEKVKVLNVDQELSRIKVLRSYDSTVGNAHTAFSSLKQKPRNFVFRKRNKTPLDSKLNRQIYFNPVDSLSVVSSSGVGIGSTLVFSNPGAGRSSIWIPARTLYFKNHNLNTGDSLTYNANSGTPIQVRITPSSSPISLTNNQVLYTARITKDIIGLSTVQIGVSETGSWVGVSSEYRSSGLLYFAGIGTGMYHSLSTNYSKTVKSEITRLKATVSTASTHGMILDDGISFISRPGITTVVNVSYNDFNRRIVINSRNFVAADVDTTNNTISIQEHNLKTGQKVIHTASTSSGGLTNNGIYYVYVLNSNEIRLANHRHEVTFKNFKFINISSASAGTISPINPPITIHKNQIISFNLSDSSLSFLRNSINYPAFEFNLYSDRDLSDKFDSTKVTDTFEVSRFGRIGIDTNANLSLKLNDKIPSTLYYTLKPVNLDINRGVKKEIIVDYEVEDCNSLNLQNDPLSGTYRISGIGSTTFSFSIPTSPKKVDFTADEGEFLYVTSSRSAFGPIANVYLSNSGKNYKKLPGISTVTSTLGDKALLSPVSYNIGNITKTTIEDIGFDYSVDNTLRPQLKIPQILKLESLLSLGHVGITSGGVNYLQAPTLLVFDGVTKKRITDVDLSYQLGDSEVSIIENTSSLNNVIPTILPVNNSNGVSISNISFNSVTKDVTVSLGATYSSIGDFPVTPGDKILIENVSVGVGSTGVGYNSSDHEYSLFEVKTTSPDIGGDSPTVTYNIGSKLKTGEIPGTFNVINPVGTLVPEKYFPIFDISITDTKFLKGEEVNTITCKGQVESWDSSSNSLKAFSDKDFRVGELIIGKSSGAQGTIKQGSYFNGFFDINSSSLVREGWKSSKGFINDNLQRLSDNFYYQNFSYSIKSQVQLSEWDNAVSSLNHTAGFKKFSDHVMESDNSNLSDTSVSSGIATTQDGGSFSGIADYISVMDLNCISDFDLALEKTINVGNDESKVLSDKIVLQLKSLQDYIESIGNRVLEIDDISGLFNDKPRTDAFHPVDSFLLEHARVRRYVVFIADRRYTQERQIMIVTILHNDSVGYINQYASVDTNGDLGQFDFDVAGTEGRLLFYPTKFKVNDYNVSSMGYNIEDTVAGIGTRDLGGSVHISSSAQTMPLGFSTTTNVVGIASTYRAGKVVVSYAASDKSYFECDEISYVHDGSQVELMDYGQLSTDLLYTPVGSPGLGTYNAYLSGSNVLIDFTPTVATASTITVNTIHVAIGDSSSSGVGTATLNTGMLDSRITSISASGSPTTNVVAKYPNNTYSSAYYIVALEDTTNNEYQISEIALADDGSTPYLTEWGVIDTGAGIGTFYANTAAGYTQLTFTPIANANVQVRVFQNAMGNVDTSINELNRIDLDNASIETGYGFYEGTESDVKRAFNLTHNETPIFQRGFVGSAATVVNVAANTIRIPGHFYVSGEELTYTPAASGTTANIGIVTATIPGVGSTDKLPETVYVVKVNDSTIKLAATAEDALKVVPSPLTLSAVGVGTTHSFTAKNQNSRVMVSIDNVIQSPLVASAVTSSLSAEALQVDDKIELVGVTSFFGGDLIKINDEIMRVDSVGFGSTNVFLVKRPWMGTGIATHASGSLITKINGGYNIVDNTINFYTAPYGLTPLSTTSNEPDQVDWVGVSTSSTFNGRSFIRSGTPGTTQEPYSKNYIFDDISSGFTGFSTTFTLTSNKSNISGISSSNAIVLTNQIYQGPKRSSIVNIVGNYGLIEQSGITSIQYTGAASSVGSDPNTAGIPVGGIIISVGSTHGTGYQPLVAAGATAVVSGLGTISSISIGNSGSGYRAGIQTVVNVGVQTASTGLPAIEFIGTAAISNGNIVSVAITNPGTGYTTSNPPEVVFDTPLSYTNIPLIHTSGSSGVGTEAKVDIVVGQGSSVIDFELTNTGYGYGQGDVLTVDVGGISGIPTSGTFKPFEIDIQETYTDSFAGWTVGDFQVFDPLDQYFDGSNTSFALSVNNVQTAIKSREGSDIKVDIALLVFINDILQVPGRGYIFDGGSYITFTEPPKVGDTSKIIFYRGTGAIDTREVDILETIKVGDNVRLQDDNKFYDEVSRSVTKINSTDTITTNIYPGPGISTNESYSRPLYWCKQTEDRFINNNSVPKTRTELETLVYPNTNLIQPVGLGSTVIFVENVKTVFDSSKENYDAQNKVRIASQDTIVGAIGTAIVSSAGTITSISVSNIGLGYTVAPDVIIGTYNLFDTQIIGLQTSGVLTRDYGFRIREPGSGTGSQGGFAFGTSYLSGDSNSSNRWATLTPVDTTGARTITIRAWRGDNTNGGEAPEWNENLVPGGGEGGESLVLFYQTPTMPSALRIDVNPDTLVGTGNTDDYILIAAQNSDTNTGLNPAPLDYTLSLPEYARVGIVSFSFRCVASSSWGIYSSNPPSVNDHYGIEKVTFSTGIAPATATATISSGSIDAVSVSYGGTGYFQSEPPPVLFGQPKPSGYIEEIPDVSYSGDFGIISGVSTTSVGVASTGIVFDLLIPDDSYLRDTSIVGTAITISGIQTGYYFVVSNSNIGNGVTSLYQNSSTVSTGSTFLDNVYEVAAVSIGQTNGIGVGSTYLAQVTVSVKDYNGLSGLGHSEFFGEYSWGRIAAPSRTTPKSFATYNNGIVGVSTSPIVERVNPLRYLNYN